MKGVFSQLCGFFQYFRILFVKSALQNDGELSLTQNENGDFVDAVPSVSLEEVLVRAVEMSEHCCELARSIKLDTELLEVRTSSSSS